MNKLHARMISFYVWHALFFRKWLDHFTHFCCLSVWWLSSLEIYIKFNSFSFSWGIGWRNIFICLNAKTFTDVRSDSETSWWYSPWYQLPFFISIGQGIFLSFFFYLHISSILPNIFDSGCIFTICIGYGCLEMGRIQ